MEHKLRWPAIFSKVRDFFPILKEFVLGLSVKYQPMTWGIAIFEFDPLHCDSILKSKICGSDAKNLKIIRAFEFIQNNPHFTLVFIQDRFVFIKDILADEDHSQNEKIELPTQCMYFSTLCEILLIYKLSTLIFILVKWKFKYWMERIFSKTG